MIKRITMKIKNAMTSFKKRRKAYKKYKKNMKKVKYELVDTMVNVFPIMNTISSDGLKMLNFFKYAMGELKSLEGAELADRTQALITDSIKTFADKFETDESRLFEITNYIVNLSPKEIQGIISHAIVETMDKKEKK